MGRICRLVCLSVLLIVGGCATRRVDPNDQSLSLVYGHFDMAVAPSPAEWVLLQSNKGSVYNMEAQDGVFMYVGVPQGYYKVHSASGFGGIPLLTRQQYHYYFSKKEQDAMATRVTEPGIYFIGAYKYVGDPGNFLRPANYRMEPNKAVSEREVLVKLIARLETDKSLVAYTRQLALAKKRLAALNK